jgi:hypothetical protein
VSIERKSFNRTMKAWLPFLALSTALAACSPQERPLPKEEDIASYRLSECGFYFPTEASMLVDDEIASRISAVIRYHLPLGRKAGIRALVSTGEELRRSMSMIEYLSSYMQEAGQQGAVRIYSEAVPGQGRRGVYVGLCVGD